MTDAEINAQVDAKVFGKRILQEGDRYYRASPAADPRQWEVPAYSTDISAAMEVVEKMRGDKWCCINIHSDHAYIWRVSFVASDPSNPSHDVTASAQGDSLPRAICEAALSALEISKD